MSNDTNTESPTQTINTTIPWGDIHAAMTAIDAARGSGQERLGWLSISDALGGTYFAAHYERRGLAGAVVLMRAVDAIAEAAWQAVHKGWEKLREVERMPDPTRSVCVAVLPDGTERSGRSQRGTQWIATRHGGTVEWRHPVDAALGAQRRRAATRRVLARLESALEVTAPISAAREAFRSIGIYDRPAGSALSDIRPDGTIAQTGWRWLAGANTDAPVTAAQAREILDRLAAE